MADVRALLAAEKQSRRIVHPHLTYSKSGALNCNVCNLNIKSEQLWPGHVKSLNHRKNVQKTAIEPVRPAKRKIESVETNDDEERNYEVDSRKKPKPASEPQPELGPEPEFIENVPDKIATPEPIQVESTPAPVSEGNVATQAQEQVSAQPALAEDVDEDEWAAFEREVAPLTQQDYTLATIEAAPVSAAEVAAQQKTNTIQQREDEAEAEKEDESRRMEEEFEVMEEMEDRIKRLRARREALRSQDPVLNAVAPPKISNASQDSVTQQTATTHDEPSSDEEETDDWYG